MRPGDSNSDLYLRLKSVIDIVIPDCFWKRLFLTKWEESGSIDWAFEQWKKGPVSGNVRHMVILEETIQQIKDDYTSRTGKSA